MEAEWVRSEEKKAKTFALHLFRVFNSQENTVEQENKLFFNNIIPVTLDIPIRDPYLYY